MKRSLALLITLLSACGGPEPHASSPAPSPAFAVVLPSGYAHESLARIVAAQPAYAAVREYDRQIAALRAATFPTSRVDANAAQRNADRAASIAASIPSRIAPREASAAAQMLDPASLRTFMEARYEQQAAFVRSHAGDSSSAYFIALQHEQSDAVSNFARALEARAEDAYANRAQAQQEREANDELTRDRAIADKRLIASLKLHDLRPNAVDRRALQGQIASIDRSLSSASSAERVKDRATLAQYRSELQRSAIAELKGGAATIHADAAANWRTRQRIASAQASIQSTLSLPNVPDERPQDVTATTAQTASALRAAGASIAGQVADDVRADGADRRNTAREITVLQTERNALYRSIVWNVCLQHRVSGC